MAKLYDSESGNLIGTISLDQLAFLVDQLEEESSEDSEYYIDADTVDWIEDQGGDPSLVAMLRRALGSRDGMDLRWSGD